MLACQKYDLVDMRLLLWNAAVVSFGKNKKREQQEFLSHERHLLHVIKQLFFWSLYDWMPTLDNVLSMPFFSIFKLFRFQIVILYEQLDTYPVYLNFLLLSIKYIYLFILKKNLLSHIGNNQLQYIVIDDEWQYHQQYSQAPFFWIDDHFMLLFLDASYSYFNFAGNIFQALGLNDQAHQVLFLI